MQGWHGSRSSEINSDSATQAFPTETHYALKLSEPLGNLIARYYSNDNRDCRGHMVAGVQRLSRPRPVPCGRQPKTGPAGQHIHVTLS
jgi:hypothetical protein